MYINYKKFHCLLKYCPIIFNRNGLEAPFPSLASSLSIIRGDGTNNVYFEMLVREQKGYPRYLLPNQYNKEYMYPDSKTYFYTGITENDNGDIVNFKQGGGQICALIVEKNKVDNVSNWLHRVNLDLTCTEKFNQDKYRQIISIGKDNTGKCTKGCEIYIEITNQQRTKNENVNYLSEFTISYHSSLDSKVMSLPINEDINGATALNNNSTFLSNALINVDTSTIFITYNSLLYKGYLVINRNVTPSSSDYNEYLSWVIKLQKLLSKINFYNLLLNQTTRQTLKIIIN